MPYALNSDINHAMTLMAGCESLAKQYNDTSRISPKTYEEVYAATVLEMNGHDLKNIDGSEGIMKTAFYKIGSVAEAVYQRFYQYGNILDRMIVNSGLKLSYKLIYNAKDAISIAKESPFTPEQIIRIINDPAAEKANVDKLVSIANSKFGLANDFKIDQQALMPVIKMASENKGNAAKVNAAIKSAGGVDKLLKKHNKEMGNVKIDKTAFTRVYDGLVKERETYMSEIEALIVRSGKVLKEGEKTVGADWLSSYPTNLKKAFELAKDLGVVHNSYGMPLLRELKDIIVMLEKDIDKLKSLVSKAKNDDSITEKQVNAALELMRIYTSIVEKAIGYETYVVNLKQNAMKVATEALYKVIVESARLENAGNSDKKED